MYKKYYKDFLEGHDKKIHLSSHSHHFWPDSAKNGMLESWEVSRTQSDDKWGQFFKIIVPKAQEFISGQINFSRPKDIAFASNTHELLYRLISAIPEKEKITILTTDSEFHSFNRQITRLDELENFNIIKISTKDTQKFYHDFKEVMSHTKIDLIFISQIFFNSGVSLSMDFLEEIVSLKNKETLFALDGYHAYCATDVNISKIEDHIFYLAGGYKYAQAGEGMCFMTLPKACDLRPVYTGWFASFETLESTQDSVEYSEHGMRFWGATIDQTAFYRFCAVWDHFAKEGITHLDFIGHAKKLKTEFLKDNLFISSFIETNLNQIGNFLSIKFGSTEKTSMAHKRLLNQGIITDFRGDILRFGFPPYVEVDEVKTAKEQLNLIYKELS